MRCKRGNREAAASITSHLYYLKYLTKGQINNFLIRSVILACTCVSVKTDGGMKTLAVFQDVQSKENFWALSFLLYAV